MGRHDWEINTLWNLMRDNIRFVLEIKLLNSHTHIFQAYRLLEMMMPIGLIIGRAKTISVSSLNVLISLTNISARWNIYRYYFWPTRHLHHSPFAYKRVHSLAASYNVLVYIRRERIRINEKCCLSKIQFEFINVIA